MDKYTLILAFFVGAFSSLSFADESVEPTLTKEQKQEILRDFTEYDLKQQTKTKALLAMPSKQCGNDSACVFEMNEKKKLETGEKVYSGRHKVSIYFINDYEFLGAYYDRGKVNEIPESKFEEHEKGIFNHFLGNDFNSFDPDLTVIKKNMIGFNLHIRPSELQHYLSDNRINGLNFEGDDDSSDYYHTLTFPDPSVTDEVSK